MPTLELYDISISGQTSLGMMRKIITVVGASVFAGCFDDIAGSHIHAATRSTPSIQPAGPAPFPTSFAARFH